MKSKMFLFVVAMQLQQLLLVAQKAKTKNLVLSSKFCWKK